MRFAERFRPLTSACAPPLNYLREFLFAFVFFTFSFSFANSGITYHGKIIKPDGVTPVTSSTTQFRIQVRTPGVGNCLLWEEQQTKDLSATNGVFTITIADSTEPTLIANTLPYNLERTFSNRTNFTSLTGCTSGNAYNPNASDGRLLVVFFREQPTDPWEQMPVTNVNYVPLALNSVQLEGYAANEFLKIDPLSTYTPLTSANVTSLMDIISGATTQYLKPATAFGGDVSGTYNAISVDKVKGVAVAATAPTLGQVLKYNGTAWAPAADDNNASPADASYTVKGIVQINTDLATSGLFIAGGVLALPNVVTAGGPTGNAQTVPVITYDQKGRLTAVSTATIDDTTKLPLAGGTMTGNINMGTHDIINATNIAATNASVRTLVLNDNDTNTITVKAPTDVTANYNFVLPATAGTNGYVLGTDGSGNLSWINPSGGSVTSVSSANNYLTVATPTTTPVLTVNVGTVANTVAAGDDARIVNAVQQAAYAADLAPAALCTNVQTPYWNTVADLWACQNIGTVPNATTAVNFTGSLAGDVSGTQGATSVDKIKGKTVSAATAVNQIMIYDGTNWVNNILSGDATLTSTGALTLKNTGTAGTYYKVTTDAQGRVTSGSNLVTGDITTALGYTPVNKAGDSMLGTLGLYATAADPSTAGWDATQKGYTWFNTTSNQVKYWDGAAIQALGISGAGLTSLGGQSGSTQTFAAGAAGTAPAIASAANVHTLNVPLASGAGVTSGTISKTDYDNFNTKLTSPLTTKGDLLTRDATTHVRVPAGTDGQILTADSAQATGLKWNTLSINSLLPSQATNSGKFLTTDGTNVSWSPVTSGTVTSVTSANSYLSVATTTTTPVITAENVGTAANTLAAGDDARITGALQTTTYDADVLPAASCTTSQTPYWNGVAGTWACQTISASGLGAFVDGGNTFTATATLGTNSNHNLEIETNGTTKMTVAASGFVGIGTTSPSTLLEMRGDNANTNLLIRSGYASANRTPGLTIQNHIDAAAGGYPLITLANSRGNLSARTALNSGDVIGHIEYTGHMGSGYVPSASVNAVATQAWSASAIGSRLDFATTANGTATAPVTRMSIDQSGYVGIGTTTPEFKLSLANDGGIIANGAYGSGANLVTAGAGTKMYWYPKKSAFRAGTVSDFRWDDANIGDYSTAFGIDTSASGLSSTALGEASDASGSGSTAVGSYANAYGTYSVAMGTHTTADSYAQTTIGKYNLPKGSENAVSWVATDPLFVIGNGTAFGSKSNAMMVLKNGNIGIGTSTPATKFDVAGGVKIGTEATACAAGLAGTLRYNGGSVEYCNGSSWQAFGVSGAGLTSLNAQTGSTQTFANGATGTAPAFSSATNVHTLNIPLASGAGVTSGTISKTDYDNFNNKIAPTSGTSGGIPYFNSATTMASSGVLTANGVVLGGGAGTTPTTTAAGTANQVLRIPNAGGAPAFGLVDLATSMTGVLPIANGGTNSSTALTNGKVIISSAGKIIEGNASDTLKTANTFVMRDGSGNIAGARGTFDQLAINGSVAGTLTVAVPSSFTNWSLTLPATAGTSGQVLSTDGAGLTTWATALTATNGYVNGGNSFGANASIGTNDNFDLSVKTNNTTRMTIQAGGNVGIGTTSPGAALGINGDVQFTNAASRTIAVADSAVNVAGKDLTLQSGGTNTGGSGAGGGINLVTGIAGQNTQGGSINMTTGGGGINSTYGDINMTARNLNFSSPASFGGTVSIIAGSNNTVGGTAVFSAGAGGPTIGTGGALTVNGGNGIWGGGDATFRAGDASGNGSTGGNTTLRAGDSSRSTVSGSYAPGALTLRGGNSGGTANSANGGAVTITGGTGGVSGATVGGLVTVQGGAAGAVATSVGGGVAISGAAGSATGTGGAGGAVTISGGNAAGTGANNGGDINLAAGTKTSTGTAGAVKVTTGNLLVTTGQIGVGLASATGAAVDINGAFNARGVSSATAGLSPAGQGRIYFDSTSNTFKVSQNGGAYADLVGASSNSFIQDGNSFGAAATLGTNDNYALNFETNATTKMTVLATGEVGIGTPSPANKLDVNGNISTVGVSGSTNFGAGQIVAGGPSGGGAGFYANVSNTAVSYGGFGVGYGTTMKWLMGISKNASDTTAMVFYEDGAAANPRLAIATGGNVGIGTISPATALDVNGAVSYRGIAAPAVSPAGQGRIYFDSTSNTYKVSQNGGAYTNLVNSAAVSGNGTTNAIPRYTASTTLGDSGLSDDGSIITASRTVVTTPNGIATGATVNLATSNIHRLASVGGSVITLQNLAHGGEYSIIVADTTSRTYTFSGCTNSYFKPANAATTAATQAIYGILVYKNGTDYDCYITWSSGFQ